MKSAFVGQKYIFRLTSYAYHFFNNLQLNFSSYKLLDSTHCSLPLSKKLNLKNPVRFLHTHTIVHFYSNTVQGLLVLVLSIGISIVLICISILIDFICLCVFVSQHGNCQMHSLEHAAIDMINMLQLQFPTYQSLPHFYSSN